MSTYSGRRAPNVSEFINNLNTVSPTNEMSGSDEDFLNFQNTDLDIFTNAEFNNADFGFGLDMDVNHTSPVEARGAFGNTSPSEAFASSDFHYSDFSGFPSNLDIKPAQPHHNVPLAPQTSPIAASPISRVQMPKVGDKRKLEYSADPIGAQVMEEGSRMAAEEDKRRRNTAASARFRVKKKQREQALEKTAKEASEEVTKLKNKVKVLEQQNNWLKGLLVERGDKVTADKFGNDNTVESEEESKEDARKDGVGTKN